MSARDEQTTGNAELSGAIEPEARFVVGGTQRHPIRAAAVVGGALAAGAGAYFGTRALAQRNATRDGKVSSVMAAAITACDVTPGNGKASGRPPEG